MAVPYTFANATASIPLSQLDNNFATAITLGNATLVLGNTTTTVGNLTLTGAAVNGTVGTTTPAAGAFTTLTDSIGNVRVIPANAQGGAYVLVAADVGKHIAISTGGVTVPSAIFSAGDVTSIYNNSASNQTITQGANVTMYLVGTATTGNRTLAQRGVVTILCVASNTFVISGGGLT